MAYRSFSTGTWQDPWFETLSPKAKLLFIYLWTNDVCNQAGVYQISLRRVEFELGFKMTDIISDLMPKVEWFDAHQIVWVKNFFRKQCANERFALGAIRCLTSIPHFIVELFTQYNAICIKSMGIDTLSIPYGYEEKIESGVCLSVTDTDTDQLQIQLASKVKGVGFEDFWKSYPKKVGKQEARKAWERQNGNRPRLETILAKVEDLKKTDQWKKDRGQFIPHPATWLNRGGWDDEPDVKVNQNSNIKYNTPDEDRAKWKI